MIFPTWQTEKFRQMWAKFAHFLSQFSLTWIQQVWYAGCNRRLELRGFYGNTDCHCG